MTVWINSWIQWLLFSNIKSISRHFASGIDQVSILPPILLNRELSSIPQD